MKNRLIRIFSILGIISSLLLVINEIRTPCYCPSYPLIGVPACYLVLGYFSLVFLSTLGKGSRILFLIGSIGGLLTAIWFSTNQLLGNAECPVFLSIPLCFVALATFGIILFLGINKVRK